MASRATQLRQTSIARPLTPTESAELDAVDAALGQGALSFDPPKPAQPHPALGQVVTSSNHDAVAQFGAALGDTGRSVSLFFVQANRRITKVATLADLSEDTLSQAGLAPLIRAHALEAGAQGAVAYYDGGDDLVSARLLALVSNGTLLDVNFGSGKPTARSMVVMPPTRDVLWGSAMDSAVRVQEPDAYSDLPAYDETAPIIVRAGRRGAYVNVPLARLKDIPIVQMPELVRLAKLLTGRVPTIKQLSRALGQFDSAQVTITLDPRIFRNSSIAAKVMAHEFGHLTDFLPDQTLARGNILGRIASLKNYLSTTLPLDPKTGGQSLTPAERSSLRKQAEKLAGPKPAKDEEADRAAWNEEVSKHYAELLQAELESRGLIVASSRERGGLSVIGASKSLVGIREELIGLTEYWKPIPENTPPSYVTYRYSGVELYADAISVLLNSPATLKQLAPTFYEAFFNHLDAKPEYKKALMDLYDFLNKPHLQVLNQRSRDIQAMFIKGDALILAKAAERKARYATFRGWMDRFRQELFDVFDPLVAKGHALERSGTAINPRYNPRFLFDEHPLADNANYEMVQHLWENVVKPVEADGFTLNDLGEYLFLQRVLNERLVTAELPPGNVAAWKRAMTAAAYINDPVKRAGEMQRLQNVLSEWEAGENNGRSGTANPGGTTPETARLGLLRMRLDSGWERFARLEIAAVSRHRFRADACGRGRGRLFAEGLRRTARTQPAALRGVRRARLFAGLRPRLDPHERGHVQGHRESVYRDRAQDGERQPAHPDAEIQARHGGVSPAVRRGQRHQGPGATRWRAPRGSAVQGSGQGAARSSGGRKAGGLLCGSGHRGNVRQAVVSAHQRRRERAQPAFPQADLSAHHQI